MRLLVRANGSIPWARLNRMAQVPVIEESGYSSFCLSLSEDADGQSSISNLCDCQITCYMYFAMWKRH
jgi:hypothetical protein